MTITKACFEELNDIENGIVYFVDKYSLKPRGIGSIRLKLPSFPDFVLKNVVYPPDLQRILLSLLHIWKKGHSIHMFDGIVEIRKSSDNKVIMTGYEDGTLM